MTYLMLANDMIHRFYPNAVTLAEVMLFLTLIFFFKLSYRLDRLIETSKMLFFSTGIFRTSYTLSARL